MARYARAFDSEDAFWDWLKVLGRSAARDAGRKQQRYTALLEKFALWQRRRTPDPVPEHDRVLHDALEESLDELPAEDRALLEGKYVARETMRELAVDSGLSERAVESRLFRLRRQLRDRILNKLRSL